ncbi:S8 family serine peptidase [Halorussus vallis]|uniref:S8 family serine peptidase n=1 Tax=Halorussus vallis TaxID=2953749 RepID=UPI0020A03683|nr:S8 family serine peptidase [Halorussus vallis]
MFSEGANIFVPAVVKLKVVARALRVTGCGSGECGSRPPRFRFPTWTSSAVAANTSNDSHDGVVPGARLLVLKALSDDGSGSTSDIAEAIRYAADQNADVVTMSLGSPVYDEAIVSAVEYAYAHGVDVVTVAAGNSRFARSPGIASPGDAQDVITVGATNGSEPSHAASAYFSQYGPDSGATDLSTGMSRGASIDVVAPGMATVVRVPVEDSSRTKLSKLSGTSMATPMVAGGAALLVDAHPSWENKTFRDWIRDGAVAVPHAAETEVGHGMFNAANSISKTDPKTEQEGAMTKAAERRDDFQRARGRYVVASVLGRTRHRRRSLRI